MDNILNKMRYLEMLNVICTSCCFMFIEVQSDHFFGLLLLLVFFGHNVYSVNFFIFMSYIVFICLFSITSENKLFFLVKLPLKSLFEQRINSCCLLDRNSSPGGSSTHDDDELPWSRCSRL